MTNKEAILMLKQELEGELVVLASMRANYGEDIDNSRAQALSKAISALNPWHRLSEETPPKVGLYRTYDENADRDCVRFQDHLWDGSDFMGDHTVHSPTHWKHRVGPEEED